MAVWWKAFSMRTVKSLNRSIREETVPVIVLERVEGIEDLKRREGGFRVIRIKLDYPLKRGVDQELTDVSLTEIGIGLIAPEEQHGEGRFAGKVPPRSS